MRHRALPHLVATLTLVACAAPGRQGSLPSAPAPDAGRRVVAQRGVVTSAHPLASDAGVEILRQGGNAVDAAVATAFAVSVGEPEMSGLGGGGGMLIWRQAEGRAEYLDFYASTRVESFRGLARSDGPDARLRIVAIPGAVAGLLEAHRRFGRLPREAVLAPAIRLAEEGVPVSQVLAAMILADSAKLKRYEAARQRYLPGGRPLQPGEALRNPELAATLRRVSAEGADGFYRGPVAAELVAALNRGGHPATLDDLAAYAPRWKRPLCTDYRGWTVLSAPPPQTGMQILGTLELLEPFRLAELGLPTRSSRAFDVVTSALRVGMADGPLVDDPNWAPVPAVGVSAEGYAAERSRLVGTGRAGPRVERGDPRAWDGAPPPASCAPLDPYRGGAAPAASGSAAEEPAAAAEAEGGETTHLSVVDAAGNAVSLTQTNSTTFGAGEWVAGFFLNDSGIDPSAAPAGGAGSSPWRIRRSAIAPTVVLRSGRVEMVVGAPGAARIPPSIVQTMLYVLDYGLDPLEAVRMPRIFPSPTGRAVQLEHGFDAQVLAEARGMGYEPSALSFGYARIYLIARRGGRWVGVADPRHDGEARGY